MINQKVADLLNEQINLEYFSGYLYSEIANHYTDEGLDGFANWFTIQTQEEIDHGNLIKQYLQNNEYSVKYKGLDDPSRNYKDNLEPLKEALSHEEDITASIHNIYSVAMEEKDYRSTQFLDWFVEEQGEEEMNANELISKYELFGHESKSLYMLDKELAARVYEAPSLVLD